MLLSLTLRRSLDHSTTRVRTPGGDWVRVRTDPQVTVYVGFESPIKKYYTGHGHIYIVYGSNGLPVRLAHSDELQFVEGLKMNPKIWDRGRRH